MAAERAEQPAPTLKFHGWLDGVSVRKNAESAKTETETADFRSESGFPPKSWRE